MESEQVRVSADDYEIVLTAWKKGGLIDAARQASNEGNEGEALVAAILKQAKGTVQRVQRFKGGKLNDGPNGEPATVHFDRQGRFSGAHRMRDGVSNDSPDGEPSILMFNGWGHLTWAVRQRDGRLHDGPNGEPAELSYNRTGRLVLARHFRDHHLVRELSPDERARYESEHPRPMIGTADPRNPGAAPMPR